MARDAAGDHFEDISGAADNGSVLAADAQPNVVTSVESGIDAFAAEAPPQNEDSKESNPDDSADAPAPRNADGPTVAGNPDAPSDGAADRASDLPLDGSPGMDGAPTSDAAGPNTACSVCTTYGAPTQLGRVTVAALNNMSGMAVSKRNAGVLYVHNDLTRTEFFALSESAALLATFTFPATPVVDMEDMAVAHCPSGSCVYLADTGDNNSVRTSYAILRIIEPEVSLGQASAMTTLVAEKLTFSYPDGPHNTESLLVDPGSDTIYVITKVNAVPSTVYRLPAAFGGAAMVAQKVVTLTVPKPADGPATGASAHPCGSGFLLRTNTILYEFRIAVGSPFEEAFDAQPVPVPLAIETKGEAVAYRPDGHGYLTTGEGAMQGVSQVVCP